MQNLQALTDRMPIEIGTFVSMAMYNRQLRSQHDVSGFDCVKFVDVAVGDEKEASTSWVVRHHN